MIEDTAFRDPLLIILQYLPVEDILSISQTCKSLQRTCMEKQLWLHVWRCDVLTKMLPRPTCLKSLDDLDDLQTKSAVMHTLRLNHNMTCRSERRVVQRVAFYQPQPITWTRIVQGSWLLVALSDAESSVLSLYSIESLVGTRVRDLLAQAFLEGPVLNGLVEVSDEYGIVIALELRTSVSTLEVLSVRDCEGSLKLVRLARHTGISHIRVLRGSSIGFALHDDLSVPSILDWGTDAVTHLSSQPDIEGGVISMIMNSDYLAYLTPRKLHVMQIQSCEGHRVVPYSGIASFIIHNENEIASADLAFGGDSHQATVQICVSNIKGIYLYAVPIPSSTTSRVDSRLSLLWSRESTRGPQGGYTEDSLRRITEPFFDRTSTTISWLERVSYTKLSRSLPALVKFVTISQDLSNARSGLQDPPCFELAEREMPALYALSARDYDQGLGLLVVGNMIGELALYSFSGDAFTKVQNALLPLDVHPRRGEELLPVTTIPTYPPLVFSWEPEWSSEAYKQSYQQLWEKYYPQELRIPRNWCRCSPFCDFDQIRFLDDIGSPAWELNNLCHFLGQVIPLIRLQNGTATLLTVGGLFLIYHTQFELLESYFAVLNPDLSLDEIVSQLPEDFEYHEMEEATIVNETTPDIQTAEEVRSIPAIGAWEQRHGIDRWEAFRARGGKARARCKWTLIEEGTRPSESTSGHLRCATRDCPLCVRSYV